MAQGKVDVQHVNLKCFACKSAIMISHYRNDMDKWDAQVHLTITLMQICGAEMEATKNNMALCCDNFNSWALFTPFFQGHFMRSFCCYWSMEATELCRNEAFQINVW